MAMLEGGSQPEPAIPRSGADDEDTRRAIEGDGQEDQLAVGGGDYRRDAADDATVAHTLSRAWLRRVARSAQRQAQPEARSLGDLRAGAGAVPDPLLRPQGEALSREAERGTWHPAELHVGQAGAARRGPGGAQEATCGASEEKAAQGDARHHAAHRRQQTCVVSG